MEQRIIKFRAWDERHKEMWYPVKAGISGLKSHDILERYEIVMQFTGLTDKNGKEIYEGDIVRHQNGYLYVVRWSETNLKWCLIQPRKPDGNTVEGVYTGGVDGQQIWRCEVLGNIYDEKLLGELGMNK